jgi:hypothetical protein
LGNAARATCDVSAGICVSPLGRNDVVNLQLSRPTQPSTRRANDGTQSTTNSPAESEAGNLSPASRGHGGELGHRRQEAGLAVGRYECSYLTDHPLAWDAAADAVADLIGGVPEDAGWTVFEACGLNDRGQIVGLRPRSSRRSASSAATS